MKNKLFFLIVLIICGPFLLAQESSIIYIKPDGKGDGSSWANATSDLYTAMLQPHAILWVASGTYYGDTATSQSVAFNIAEGVKLYGGFVGNEPSDYDLNLRDWEKNPTILDGRGKKRVLKSQYFDSVMMKNAKPDSILIDGIILQHGLCNYMNVINYVNGGGGACLAYANLKNCIIRNNMINSKYSTNHGVGLYAKYSSLSNCKITGNEANRGNYIYGVGFCVEFSEMTDCDIYENSSHLIPIPNLSPRVYGVGGYLFASTMKHCRVHHNVVLLDSILTYSYAGGVFVDSSLIESCEFAYDSIIGGSKPYGGGLVVYNKSGIVASNIHHNYAGYGGGVELMENVWMQNTRIYNNHSTISGGGIFEYNATMTNCVISNNTSKNTGGGISIMDMADWDATRLYNCNIVRNFSEGDGSAIYHNGKNTAHCLNDIVWGNRCSQGKPACSGNLDIRYSALEGGYSGEGNLHLASENQGDNPDSAYVSFLHYSDETESSEEESFRWLLSKSSTCIDKGTPDTLGLHLPLIDLIGNPRIYNQRIDIGANEYIPNNKVKNVPNEMCTVYPNPAHSMVHIHSDESFTAYRVVDMMGRVCCLGETESQTDICLHTATWPAGMYIVQLQTPKAIYNLKFIIK